MPSPAIQSAVVPPRDDAAVRANDPHLLGFLFLIFAVCVLVRVGLSANIVDLFLNYTSETGSILEKIHPGTFGLLAVSTVACLSLRIELEPWELRIVRALLALLVAVAMLGGVLMLGGRAGSAGYLVDTYAVACVSGIVFFAFPPAWRAGLALAIVAFLILGAVLAIGEAAIQQRLMPYPYDEAVFRPTGLMGHPLAVGLSSAVAIGFAAATNWSPRVKVAAATVLLIATAASEARLATLIAFVVVVTIAFRHDWPGIAPYRKAQIRILAAIGAVLALALLVAVVVMFGFMDRIQSGLVDESTMARVTIYRVFELVSWSDILFGADVVAIREIATERFNLPYIESSLVVFVFHFGLFGALFFVCFLARAVLAIVTGADRNIVLAVAAFFVMALSNNALSVKSPMIVMLFVLAIGLRSGGKPAETRTGSSPSVRSTARAREASPC